MWGLVSAAAVAAAGAAPQADGLELGLAAVRQYRANGGQTLVDGFVRVPFLLLEPVRAASGGFAAYRIAVVVRDSSGLQLFAQSWSQRVQARLLATRRGSTVESFSFAATPGGYRIAVTVTDSASGRVARAELGVEAFAAMPPVSDLLLASALRMAAGGDTIPRPGEIRKGGVLLEAADRPGLTPQRAQLGYYLEIYRTAAETVTVRFRVLRPDGSLVVAAGTQRLPLAAGGGVARGSLDLAGLPPGDYRLEATVGDSGAVRSASFAMAGFEAEAALAAAAPPAEDRWGTMREVELDSAYLPLVYLMTSDEQGIYGSLTLEGKRSFLRQFWTKRDLTPGTARNEEEEAFYARIGDANRRFREGGAAETPGWRTDRGRIFIRYGPPDEVLQRPEAGATNPYEAWKYTRERLRKYVFLDQTKFGNYVLIWTDDIREPSRPNWRELLGREGVEDVRRF